MTRTLRPLLALTLIAAAAGLSGCVGVIDENAVLNPRALESPGVDTARESNYPRGSANPNPAY
jgi:hypothetical protein